MFNLSIIYIFIPVRGCVGRGPNALLCSGHYNAVKMAQPPNAKGGLMTREIVD